MLLALIGILIRPKKNSCVPPLKIQSVSILIPFRNENENLIILIKNILQQIRETNSEIILVNDHSENDLPANIQLTFEEEKYIRLYHLPASESGKKKALKLAHTKANKNWRIHLDADIKLDKNWFKTLVESLSNTDAEFVAMPVIPEGKNNALSAFEKMESLALMSITEGGFRFGNPLMANGANLAISKNAFESSGAFAGDTISSGDDMFLLQKLVEKKQIKTEFIFKNELIAQVDCNISFGHFFSQRLRWLSKSRHYKLYTIQYFVSVIGLSNIVMPIFVFGYIVENHDTYLWLILLKYSMDLLLLIPASIKYHQSNVLPWFLLLSPLYPLYTIALLIASFAYKPMWKGRKISV